MITKPDSVPPHEALAPRSRRVRSAGLRPELWCVQRLRSSGVSPARRGASDAPVVVAGAMSVAVVVVIVLLLAGWLWWKRSVRSAPSAPGGLPGPSRQVDQTLIRYRQSAVWPVALGGLRALAVGPNDEVYVAGTEWLCVLGPDGIQRAKFALAGQPYCLAAGSVAGDDTSGEGVSGEGPSPHPAGAAPQPRDDVLLYVGLSDHVEVWDAQGRRRAAWDVPGEKARFTSIVVAGEHVFVADAGSRVVWHYDRQGRLQGEIGRPDRARHIPGFLITSFHFDLALGADGLLYVVNPRALRLEGYTFRGDLETYWGKGAPMIEGFFGCCNPAHFSVLPDGRFVTVDKGLPHVKVYSPQGRFEWLVASAAQMEDLPADLAADGRGRVLVLDARRQAVRVFEPVPASEEGDWPK